MSVEAPNLDDRRFQDLVDDALRLAGERLPEWSPSRPTDPGVVLIEAFAWMTDQLLYRLNRVPDRLYLKFLELIGVRLIPPTSARTVISFWIADDEPRTVDIPVGTRVSTQGADDDPAIVFTTEEGVEIVPAVVDRVVAAAASNTNIRDLAQALATGQAIECFQVPPVPGDTLVVGLVAVVPGCVVALDIDCDIEGVGVDPAFPPLVWEAWTGDEWSPCLVDSDGTGGLNRSGRVVIDVPRTHVLGIVDRTRAGWLRCRVTDAYPSQPMYPTSPVIRGLRASTIGGWATAINAELIENEALGVAKGTPGARLGLKRHPVVAGIQPFVIEVREDAETTQWTQVPDFASSGPDDAVFVLDAAAGEVAFGPAVRMADGMVRGFGRVPLRGAEIRVPLYQAGGGSRGNVMAGTLTVLVDPIPAVRRVENRRAAFGGAEGEDIESAKVRGPLRLRTGGRAVTAEDYEQIARDAAPEVARVRCMADTTGESLVRVLIVPAVPTDDLRFPFGALVPSENSLVSITDRLAEARVIGTRVVVEPPVYQGITVAARLRAGPRVNRMRVQDEALRALYRMFHPVVGGPEGTGWPFGRPVRVSEIHATLQGVNGVDTVEEVHLFGADPVTGQRGRDTDQLEVEQFALVHSYEHQVAVA